MDERLKDYSVSPEYKAIVTEIFPSITRTLNIALAENVFMTKEEMTRYFSSFREEINNYIDGQELLFYNLTKLH
ncbi:hypothetical protein AGMMS49975_23550 [Clostridia bacterium]|nr:hypothetical protein AGMMS49975_23550 [Clostridia bacterium]